MTDDDEDQDIGRMLSGRYQLDSKLGGRMPPRVYVAFDTQTDRDVVVKWFDPARDRETRLRRLQFEGLALRCLQDERIVRLLDWDVDASGIEFLVLERLEGCTLREYMDTARVIAPEWAVRIAVWTLEALEAVHAGGVLHRDLKPGNIILIEDGLKLIDFDLAIPLSSAEHDSMWSRITMPGTCVGTPGYFPPERVRDAAADPRDDVYAVGAILYEMLVRRRPYTPAFVKNGQIDLDWSPPPAVFPKFASESLPQALQDITLRALEKFPERRFAGAEEMRQALLDLKP